VNVQPVQCYGPKCVRAARANSKYCSDECGTKLAAQWVIYKTAYVCFLSIFYLLLRLPIIILCTGCVECVLCHGLPGDFRVNSGQILFLFSPRYIFWDLNPWLSPSAPCTLVMHSKHLAMTALFIPTPSLYFSMCISHQVIWCLILLTTTFGYCVHTGPSPCPDLNLFDAEYFSVMH